MGSVNYIRNSVKGHRGRLRRRDPHLYLSPPTIPSSSRTSGSSPPCFSPLRKCPPTCAPTRATTEALFRVQAEIYRTYHMQDPQAFYNKEDLWDLAALLARTGQRSKALHPRPTLWPACLTRTPPSSCSSCRSPSPHQGQPDRAHVGALRPANTWASLSYSSSRNRSSSSAPCRWPPASTRIKTSPRTCRCGTSRARRCCAGRFWCCR